MRYNSIYNDSKYDIELRQTYGNWIKDYSLENYGSDWKYILGLSYRNVVGNYRSSINSIKKLYHSLVQYDSSIDGFISTEADGGYYNLHHHLVLNSGLEFDRLNNVINKFWGKIGAIDLKRYDSNGNFCFYMVKHLNKSDFNNLEILSKLD